MTGIVSNCHITPTITFQDKLIIGFINGIMLILRQIKFLEHILHYIIQDRTVIFPQTGIYGFVRENENSLERTPKAVVW